MKKAMMLILLLGLLGCAYEGERLSTYLEDPRAIIRDPHFGNYKEKRDALESQYLKKEITYAEYVGQMNELDDNYSREVQERDEIIHADPY